MRAPPLRERIDKATLEELYWQQRHTAMQIAQRYQTSYPNVLALMAKYGIPRRPPGKNVL